MELRYTASEYYVLESEFLGKRYLVGHQLFPDTLPLKTGTHSDTHDIEGVSLGIMVSDHPVIGDILPGIDGIRVGYPSDETRGQSSEIRILLMEEDSLRKDVNPALESLSCRTGSLRPGLVFEAHQSGSKRFLVQKVPGIAVSSTHDRMDVIGNNRSRILFS